MTATGPVKQWSVSFDAPGTTAITNAWGIGCAITGTRVTCTGREWAQTLTPGQNVRVGFQAAATRAPQSPTLTLSAS